MVVDRQISVVDAATPEWVNQELFANLLSKEVADFQKIFKFSTKRVDNCKDNYLGVKIEYEGKDGKRRVMGFVLKTATFSSGENFLPYLNNSKLAQENNVNFEILPKFRKLYEEENTPINFAPMVYKFPQPVPEDYILFEDLQYKGYRCIQKSGGLSSKQMEIALKNLAAFHAASVVGAKFDIKSRRTFCNANKETQILADRIFYENLRGYSLKHYEDKIKSLQTQFLENRSFSNQQEFQVLLLGNTNLDNMLFQIDAFGNIKDFVFTNLGSCSYGNPAKDLWYILLSSTNSDVKLNRFEYYVKFYYDQLIGCFKLLKYKGDVQKLSELHYDLLKNNKWAYAAS
uniref:CHK kinase-like domain-containing protein n=1 Tax=Musca domestica TaxID=7370 RepID=A0A1I8NKC6_MUSDO